MTIMVALRKSKPTTPLPVLYALVFLSEILAAGGAGIVDGGAMRKFDESPALHFASFGDWGADLMTAHDRNGQRVVADGVAHWLEKVSNTNNAPFILSLGDNFYPWGVEDSDDMAERFAKSFEEVYSHGAFDDVPWYAIAGNHDYRGNVTAQMNYPSTRWIFPDHFYRIVRELRIPGGTMKVEIIAIDTMQLAYHEGSSHEIRKSGERWIRHHLQHSDADYLIVAGHYPVRKVPNLDELLNAHDVSAYISGHDHCHKYERRNGVEHFTSGTGMEINQEHECYHDTIESEDLSGGFLSFDARVDKMVVNFHDQNGNEIHKTEINPRHMNERRPGGSIEIS